MPTCPVKNCTKCNHIKQVTYIITPVYKQFNQEHFTLFDKKFIP